MVFFPKLMNLQFNMKLCRKLFCTICTEFLDECVSNPYIILKWRAFGIVHHSRHYRLIQTCAWHDVFFHWMRVDVVAFLRTLAFVQINDDWINERSKRPESKNTNKSIARIHTICALCNASWSWVFYHLLKIIYIFISAIFFTRAFFSFFLLIAHFRLDFDGHIFFFSIFFSLSLFELNHFFFNMWLWILFFLRKK